MRNAVNDAHNRDVVQKSVKVHNDIQEEPPPLQDLEVHPLQAGQEEVLRKSLTLNRHLLILTAFCP